MKIGIAGVGHWHTPLYLDPLLELGGHDVVCVSDSNPEVAESYGERLHCAHGPSFAELCSATRPDFAFVLGIHSDMAAEARTLIAARIPFAIEKPAGISAAEVEALADEARRAGTFVSVPLVFRSSGFFRAVRELMASEEVLYADFKFIAGLPERYRAAGCDWMFDRGQAGGGTLVNLGVHFIDLIQQMSPKADVRAATSANMSNEGDVEDYVTVVLRSGDTIGRIETGYLYPAPAGVFDMHFSVRTERHYLSTSGPGKYELSRLDGSRKFFEGTTTNMPIYPTYVADVLQQVRDGAPPVADLDDMARVMAAVEQAYALAAPKGAEGFQP